MSNLVSGAALGQQAYASTALGAGAYPVGTTTFAVNSSALMAAGTVVSIGSGASQENVTVSNVPDGSSFISTAPSTKVHNGGDTVSFSNASLLNPATVELSVFANDAQGNRILGSDPYVDANGNLLTITVSKSETKPATPIGSTLPAVSLTRAACTSNTCTYTQPGGTASVGYNGNDLQSVQFNPAVTCNALVGGASTPCVAPAIVAAKITFTRTASGGTINVGAQPAVKYSTVTGAGVVTSGLDGKLWVTQPSLSQISRVDPATGSVLNTYATPGKAPSWIVAGSDGALWFDYYTGGVAHFVRMLPDGTQTADITTAATDIRYVANGPDGNIWFTDLTPNAIGRLNVATQSVQEFSSGLTANAGVTAIAAGGDGRMWFTEYFHQGVGNYDGSVAGDH